MSCGSTGICWVIHWHPSGFGCLPFRTQGPVGPVAFLPLRRGGQLNTSVPPCRPQCPPTQGPLLTQARSAVVVQPPSRVRLFVTPWAAARQASLSFPISQSLLKLMSTESVILLNHLLLCRPLLLLPSTFPSISIFCNELVLPIRWPKYWSFSFSISPSNEYSGLISFRMDWLDLLAVQGTLKNLLQHHSLKASVFWCSAFFMVQLSHLYMIAGEIIVLPIQILVSKMMSLLFNTLSRFVICHFPLQCLRF